VITKRGTKMKIKIKIKTKKKKKKKIVTYYLNLASES
jgi:hypothetical protein